MKAEKGRMGKFKSKGSDILKAPTTGPGSMNEFLENKTGKYAQKPDGTIVQLHKSTDSQKRNTAFAQNHKSRSAKNNICTNTQNSKKDNKFVDIDNAEAVERIHVHIRKDLADKLIEMVYARKREGKSKRQASQRHIIEQALEAYFDK